MGRRNLGAPQGALVKPRLREVDVQRQCVDFMALDGWRPLKTDPCSDRSRGKGFGEKGMADHLFIRYAAAGLCTEAWAQVLWVEFKRPAGYSAGIWRPATKAAEHQMAWHRAERFRGARAVMAGVDFEPDFDGFVAWYRKSGLLRREGL